MNIIYTANWCSYCVAAKNFFEKHKIQNGDKVYTSGKEGIFAPGTPIGEIIIENNIVKVLLFSDLSQITFVNVNLEKDN